MTLIAWHHNTMRNLEPSEGLAPFDGSQADQVWRFHRSWPGYRPTPLRSLPALATNWGLKTVLVKDESERWGLKAFKGLGGTYGVGRYLGKYYGIEPPGDFLTLKNHFFRKRPVIFATATDGNHGVGIAWAAKHLGHTAKIYMPRGSAPARVEAIRKVGGEVKVTALDYDDTVEWVAAGAEKQGWVLMQDTSLGDGNQISQWIMQGYMTLMAEHFLSNTDSPCDKPTHVIVQAGVGSFAASVVAFLANLYGNEIPRVIVVEPTATACLYDSALVGDHKLYPHPSPQPTVMAGLACGVANPSAWEILRHWVTTFAACDDSVTARGMRILGNPLQGDPRIVSGESGAVGLGLLSLVMERPEYAQLREELELGAEARVLLFNTEGATDPAMYRRIAWDGYLGEFQPGVSQPPMPTAGWTE